MSNPFRQPPIRTDFEPVESLSHEAARDEAAQLSNAIEHHNRLYYVENRPVIEDHEFDALFRRLQALEEHFPDVGSDHSPTQRVGAPPAEELVRVDHYGPLLSLNSAVEETEIANFERFLKRELEQDAPAYVVEPKLDGLSVEVAYRDGVFERGATRGDGRVGEDVSANLRTIRTLPLELTDDPEIPGLLAVRGEVLMSRSGFARLNERRRDEGKALFANPRNAAAGSLRQLDSGVTARVPLEVYFYEVIATDGGVPNSHWELLSRFPAWGLRTNPLNRRVERLKEIVEYYQGIVRDRDALDYEIDGVVIKLDDRTAREKLGARNRSPRWAIAWKFPPRRKTSVVREIRVQVGRTGILTPVAVLEPVEIGGVTVSRASLHNAEEVARKDVRAGDEVRVQRAGDVIPEVLEVVDPHREDRSDPFSMPPACPACATEIVRDGAYHVCPAGLTCPPQLTGSLKHFVSRDAMDIENLGDKNLEQMVERGLITSIPDLYTLTREQLTSLDRFAEKSADNVCRAIESSKSPRLDRFVYALGIPHVGEHVAHVLAGRFGSLQAIMDADEQTLVSIHEIGPETARAVRAFFAERQNREAIERLLDLGVSPTIKGMRTAPTAGGEAQSESAPVSAGETEDGDQPPLTGLTIVATGSLERFSRKEIKEAIEINGGRASSSVSSNTDYLVAGENAGSKLDRARELGVTVIDENEFLKMIGRSQ